MAAGRLSSATLASGLWNCGRASRGAARAVRHLLRQLALLWELLQQPL